MKTPQLRAVFLLPVSLAILVAQVGATAQDVFEPVPEGLRARLIKRLPHLILRICNMNCLASTGTYKR